MFRPCMVIIGLILEQIVRYKLGNARNEIPFLQIVQWISPQIEDALIKLRVNSLPYIAAWVLSTPAYRRTTEPPGCPADHADSLFLQFLCFNPITNYVLSCLGNIRHNLWKWDVISIFFNFTYYLNVLILARLWPCQAETYSYVKVYKRSVASTGLITHCN